MTSWSNQTEEALTLLIKDWLKHNGKTQADLKESLHSDSPRMPILIEILKKDFLKGGIAKVASRLCTIEQEWLTEKKSADTNAIESNPFGQLDLLLQEMKDNFHQTTENNTFD